jgi:diphosphomevalonate decarboxylase
MNSPISAIAHPNIALIKYWGDLDHELHIPANGSISMNLAQLNTQTTVVFDTSLRQDEFFLNGDAQRAEPLHRVSRFLDRVRNLAGISTFARVQSENNFPIAAGIASSAAGFAALSLAATVAAGLQLDEPNLSRLAPPAAPSRVGSLSGRPGIPTRIHMPSRLPQPTIGTWLIASL